MSASQKRQQAPIAASKPNPKPKPERGLPTFKTHKQQQHKQQQQQQQQHRQQQQQYLQQQQQTGSIAAGNTGHYKRPGIGGVGRVDIGIYRHIHIYVCLGK